jgi:predicted NAD/FAD-binding protein
MSRNERIAIVGSGVAGLVAAHHLHPKHDITVFEAASRIGGHVHTWELASGGRTWSVDSGFIVFNDRNYPNFTRLLTDLGVESQPSSMSFSVRHDGEGLEYNGSTLRQLFVQPRNLARPAYLRMLAEVLRFNRSALAAVSTMPDRGRPSTLAALLESGGYSDAFRDWYLLPMGSAIWSLPPDRVLEMPAAFFTRFFHNHGMLTVDDRPLWRTVRGGSTRYTEALVAPFRDRIRTNTPVRRVERLGDAVLVDGQRFDRVVLACHSDQALAILADPTPGERVALAAIPYQSNDVILHTDTSILPRARSAWGAWNYRVRADRSAPAVVTYDMNILQALEAPETFCVTLNGEDLIDPARIVGRVRYDHPVATTAGERARAFRNEMSGRDRTHYCGAYWGNGFHEDGVVSALAVVQEIAVASARHAPLRVA